MLRVHGWQKCEDRQKGHQARRRSKRFLNLLQLHGNSNLKVLLDHGDEVMDKMQSLTDPYWTHTGINALGKELKK